jgi:hypothetical protein
VQSDRADAIARLGAARGVVDAASSDLAEALRVADADRSALAEARAAYDDLERDVVAKETEANLSKLTRLELRVRLNAKRAEESAAKASAATTTAQTAASAVSKLETEIGALEREGHDHPAAVAARTAPLVERLVTATREAIEVTKLLVGEHLSSGSVEARPSVLTLPLEAILARSGVVLSGYHRALTNEALSAGGGRYVRSNQVDPEFAAAVVRAVAFALQVAPNPDGEAVDLRRRELAMRLER